jgi:acetolactate synthase-1/2/3 large subunit
MKKRVVDIIMDELLAQGIDQVFAVVGGGAMHLDHALLKATKIKKIFNHHEQACAIAAEAYARYSGKMAVVCVTSGPGATNTLTGVMGAWQDSIPMLVLSGQVRDAISVEKSGLPLRYRGIQEFEIIPTVKNMTKYAVRITNPCNIKHELEKAIQIANTGRKGPVWLDLPLDIQNARVKEEELYVGEHILEEKKPTESDLDYLFERMKKANRPCLLLGSGVISSYTIRETKEFIEKVGIPTVGGSWVADNFYNEHRLYFGISGDCGPRVGNFILQNADLIVTLGNSLGFRQTGFNQEEFAPNAEIIMIDADENEAKKPGLKISRLIHSELRHFFNAALKKEWSVNASEKWMEYCNTLRNKFSPFEAVEQLDMDERVCCYYFWQVWQECEEEDSVLVLGNNVASGAKLQIGKQKEKQRVIANYACGSMGYDLPAAIGTAAAAGRTVTCATGDGSVMMNLQELQTIKQYNLPINVVVFSNDGYGAIRQTCKNFFNGEYIGCTPDSGISFPDFRDVARTFDFDYILCRTNREVKEAIQQMQSSCRRVVLEVLQKMDDPTIPRVVSRMDENGVMQTPKLHDMYPFLGEEELNSLMFQS